MSIVEIAKIFKPDYCEGERALLAKIKIYLDNTRIQLNLNEIVVNYLADIESPIKYAETAFGGLAEFIEHSKFGLETFQVTNCTTINKINRRIYFEKLLEIFKKDRCLQVKTVHFTNFTLSEISSVLPYFRAGTLEKIEISCRSSSILNLEEITYLDQWKHAKSFEAVWDTVSIPIELLFRFNSFRVNIQFFPKSDAIKVRDILEKSPAYEYGFLGFSIVNEIKTVFGQGIGDAYRSCIIYKSSDNRKFKIDCSAEHLEIRINA
ncbi:DUF38 domain-containing protein [Caenorhabditis elegans]|uniref:DUF38 domain-containing protein n=1 Tax=Caenorhabditis elegans TaxID=6239 RepID=D5MCV2_CAEEL|nr:DUF38 domain-containing protein [Caenorhabditis elegans]CBL43442.1 DUF38 domain-containing protein [Caenorhabditis elegans]|eukprot:NP_001256698.1 F-box A protein [Caenorhabditis elegans]